MRLGTTLCLHLNNPRARGYAYPRDFVPSTAALHCIQPPDVDVVSCPFVSPALSAFACLFLRGEHGKHIIPYTNTRQAPYVVRRE